MAMLVSYVGSLGTFPGTSSETAEAFSDALLRWGQIESRLA